MRSLLSVIIVILFFTSCGDGSAKTKTATPKAIEENHQSMKVISTATTQIKGSETSHFYDISITKVADGMDTFYVASNREGGVYLIKK